MENLQNDKTALERLEALRQVMLELTRDYPQADLVGDYSHSYDKVQELKEYRNVGLELGKKMVVNDKAFLKLSKGDIEGKITHKEFIISHVHNVKDEDKWEIDLSQKHKDGTNYVVGFYDTLESILSLFQ